MTGVARAQVWVTEREYNALLGAVALFSTDQEGRDVERSDLEDLRALHRLIDKCKAAGLRWNPD